MNSTCINPKLVQELHDLDGMDGDESGDEDALVDEDVDRSLVLPNLHRAKIDP